MTDDERARQILASIVAGRRDWIAASLGATTAGDDRAFIATLAAPE